MSIYTSLRHNAAKFEEEAECYGVSHESAQETLSRSFGSVQQEIRDQLVREYGSRAVEDAERGITFGAECDPDRGPPYYRRQYIQNLRELRQRLRTDE